MKKKIILLLTAIMAFMIASCTNPNLPGGMSGTDDTGTVQFSWSQPGQDTGSRSSFSRNVVATGNNIQDAKKVVISIEAADGTVVHNKKELNLFNFNGSFLSEPLSLKVGTYKLTEYLLLDAAGTVIYATPKAGSPKAHLVANPLPVNFTVAKDMATSVKPEVVDAAEVTPPELGYIGFDFVEVKTLNFLVTVMAYDATADNFVQTAAYMDLTSDTKAYSFNLAPATNKIAVNDLTGNYTVTVKKGGYQDYRATYSAAELKGFFQNPLIITLSKLQAPANGILTFADPAFEAEIRTALNEPTADITTTAAAGLTYLNISNKNISSLKGIENLTNLTAVNFYNCGLTDVGALAHLTNLKIVNLTNNNVTDLRPIADLTKVTHLQLGGNKNLSDLSPVAGLTSVVSVQMPGANISDISALAGMNDLVEVYLNDNSITDLTPLAGKAKLQRVAFNRNKITDISPLANLPVLYSIALEGNSISDIGSLQTLPKMYELFLSNNSITDLTPLLNNADYATNVHLHITGNPLSTDAESVQIPALQAKGVKITFLKP